MFVVKLCDVLTCNFGEMYSRYQHFYFIHSARHKMAGASSGKISIEEKLNTAQER
jgi:hypothetical protein